MSNRRRKEILKRIQKRKKTGQWLSESGMKTNLSKHQVVYPDYEESHDFTWGTSPNGMKNGHHPLFNRDIFLFKFLFSAILVLVVAISFKMPSPQFEPVRQAVHTVMNTDSPSSSAASSSSGTSAGVQRRPAACRRPVAAEPAAHGRRRGGAGWPREPARVRVEVAEELLGQSVGQSSSSTLRSSRLSFSSSRMSARSPASSSRRPPGTIERATCSASSGIASWWKTRFAALCGRRERRARVRAACRRRGRSAPLLLDHEPDGPPRQLLPVPHGRGDTSPSPPCP